MTEDSGRRLVGKVALVTGGAKGIGRASTLMFLAEGASVLAADIDVDAGAQLERDVDDLGVRDRLRFVACDVGDEDAVEAAVHAAVDGFGRLDCVYNNAGTSTPDSPVVDLDHLDWQRIVDINLNSAFFGIKHGARAMRRNPDGGAIVNTASLAALTARSGPAAYSAAKAAIVNLTMTAAVQLAPDRIRVNAISPGWILTSLVMRLRGSADELLPVMERAQPWPEPGMPQHIAAAATFLLSDDARFVTGHNLVVDGGLTAAGPRFLDRVRELEAELALGGS